MASRATEPIKLFISYSHRDERFREQLQEHLYALKRRGLIEDWHDHKIIPGEAWEDAINENLEASGIILLLVSSSFIASPYCYNKEMRRAVEKHEGSEARVIPVILRPVDWSVAPFARLQALPRNGRPVTRWSNRDEAWLDVAMGIRRAVEELTSEPGERDTEELAEVGVGGGLTRYREAVESAWAAGELDWPQVERLNAFAVEELGLDASSAAAIEREVMGDTKEALFESQQRAKKDERKSRLDELYTQACRLHRLQEWQAVVDIFAQIHAEDPGYPDPEGLIESAREALEDQQRGRKAADLYDRGLRHMEAEEWSEAVRCFEEVRQLEPDYRDAKEMLARVERELVERTPISARYSHSTPHWEYVDFELEIHEEREPRKYPVAVRSPEGQAQAEMRFPLDEWELKEKLRDLEIALLRSGGGRRSLGTAEEKAVQEFGRILFEALLVGEVRARYDLSLREARKQNKGLRLKLHIRPPELSSLPWEFLYDPERDYLCLSSTTPLVRYLDRSQPSTEPLSVTPPLKILGMVASPQGLSRLDVEHEKRLVEEAVRELRADGLVELTWLEGQTWRDLQRRMRRGEWHVFHFLGHGGFDPATEEGAIALADEEGRKDLLRATALARLLDDHNPLRLVFLNSCEGARGSNSDAFSSTAATLVRCGIPAVVAMQYEITDVAAIEFSRDFYEALADGLPVDAAVAEARTAVSMKSALEWGTPVLYMRTSDGLIFDIQQTSERKEGRRKRLEELYARARRLHQDREWRAVVDVFDQIRTLDPEYPDREDLLGSARETLELERRVAALYDHGLRRVDAEDWTRALGYFEEVQQLEPGYRETERLLARVRHELAERTERAQHDAPEDQGEHARGGSDASRKPDFLPGWTPGSRPSSPPDERESRPDRPPTLPGW